MCPACMCVLRIHRSSSIRSRLKRHTREAHAQHKIAPCRRELELRYECVVTVYKQQRSILLCVYVCIFCPSVTRSPLWHPWHLLWNASGGSISFAAAGQRAAGREETARHGNLKIQACNQSERKKHVDYLLKKYLIRRRCCSSFKGRPKRNVQTSFYSVWT